MRPILDAWEDFRIVADEYGQLDGERVLVLEHRSGCGKTSGLLELSQVRAEGAHVFHVRDGKVTRLGVNTKRNKEARCRRSD